MSFISLVYTRSSLIRCVGICGLVGTTTLMSLATASPSTLPGNCPKILMFDGLEIKTQNNATMAQYWGQTIGVDGFFVNEVMASWNDSVGDDENSSTYRRVKGFQQLYSKYGVTDNYIKAALFTARNWNDPADMARVVNNFRQAAHLARYAGMKGLSLDLEPYQPTWDVMPAIPDKEAIIYRLGEQIGSAVLAEFPDATIIVLPEILLYACPPYPPDVCNRYALASRFWDGLIQGRGDHFIIAAESTYDAILVNQYAAGIRKAYGPALIRDGVNPRNIPIALGIWPLGKTYTDKSARSTPAQFAERLKLAFQEPSPYVWIYGHGSAWQKDGPFGKGNVDPHFEEFVQVIHRVKQSCLTGGTAFLP